MPDLTNKVSTVFNKYYTDTLEYAFSRSAKHWPLFGDPDLNEIIQARQNSVDHHSTRSLSPAWKKTQTELEKLSRLHKQGQKKWSHGNNLLKSTAIFSKNWENPAAVENVVCQPSDPAVYGSTLGLLANANLVHWEYAGMVVDLEKCVIRLLANMVGWNTDDATGVFTQGGTFCNLYGYLLGIRKSLPEAKHYGMGYTHDYRIINSQGGHYSNTINLSLLGVNIKEKTIRIKLTDTNEMDLKDFELQLESCFRLKCTVPTIMLTMGTTDTFGVDRVKPIWEIRNRLCRKFKVETVPHIHVDSAVGWTMLFFLNYDFQKNPLRINSITLKGLKSNRKKFSELKYADSFTVDFQKWGYVPYTSSLVMIRNKVDLKSMENDPENFSYFDKETQGHTHLQSTIECSRGAVGVFGAFSSLYYMGTQGYQIILAHCLQNANYFRSRLQKLKNVKVLSTENQGPSVGFRLYDPQRVRSANAEFHFEYRNNNSIGYLDRLTYNSQYHHKIFKARPKIGLFTNWVENIAHTQYDELNTFFGLPGEKAVFMNPNTTRKDIDVFVDNISPKGFP